MWHAILGRRSVAWAGTLLIAAVLALSAFDIARSYRAVLHESARDLEGQARMLAEQTARGLQAVEIVLRHVADEHDRGRLDTLSPQALNAYLREQSIGLTQIKGLTLHDRDGQARALSWLAPGTHSSIAHMDAFRTLRAQRDTTVWFGSAAQSPADGEWMIPVGRRLEARDGGFSGVVGARLRIEYFTNFYRDVRLDVGTTVTLMHREGVLLARHPPLPGSVGRPASSLQALLDAPRKVEGEASPARMRSPVDGVDRFFAQQPVAGYPVHVIVSRDANAVLSPWRAQAAGAAVRTLALAALAALLLAIVARQFRRLDAARDRFALAVAGSDDGIWDKDYVKRTVFASARARELMGLMPGPEVQTMDSWFASLRLHADDAPHREAAINAHLEGRTPAYEGEYRVLHGEGADAVYRWVRVRGLCVRDAQGRPLRLAGSIADINALKCAESSLRKSEARYELAVLGSDDGIWEWDFVREQAFESARARELQGLPPGPEQQPLPALLGSLRVHADDAPRRADAIHAHLLGLTPAYECEYRVQDAEGAFRWVRARAVCVRDAQGQPQRMAGSVSDIDARKRAEEALRRSEERYQLAVLGSTEGLWDWDMQNDMLFLSPRCQELLWQTVGEPLRPRREWIAATDYHPDDRPVVRAAVSAHLHGQTQHMSVEYRLRHHQGQWHWYRQRGVVVRDADGKPYRMAGSMEDITDRRRAEVEREQLEQQLRQSQRLEAIGTLAGGIAHDFNNILAAIVGYGEMVQKNTPEGTPTRRHIDATLRAAMRAKSLVERILAFSRSGLGERVPVPVQAVVGEALDLVLASLPSRVRLHRALDAGAATVLGDATQIHQVVMNLCANAVQAMSMAGGQLEVVLGCRTLAEAHSVSTSRLAPGHYVVLAVRDTGVGIAPSVMEHMFDPFFTTRDIGVGTGLGLSLVHGIVTDLGGGIEVQSEVGRGSTMTVYLPQGGDASPATPRVEHASARGRGETVLLVDDEDSLVQLGEEMMASLGYEPVGFTSSRAALASFLKTPARFDLVVTDEAMPEMTGSDLTRAIRKVRPDIPVVMMTGYVSASLVARAKEAGITEVLGKPLVSGEIARSIAAALRH